MYFAGIQGQWLWKNAFKEHDVLCGKEGALSMTLEVRVSNAIALELYKDLWLYR